MKAYIKKKDLIFFEKMQDELRTFKLEISNFREYEDDREIEVYIKIKK